MLTADLLVFRRRKGRVHPHRLDPRARTATEAAESVLGLCRSLTGQTRGELEEALADAPPPGLPVKVTRGLGKLALDGCTFAEPDLETPRALRTALFDAAAAAWRDGAGDPARWRPEVVRTVGARHGLSAEAVEAAMFADLPEHQQIEAAPDWDPPALIHRYNLAQVQGLLLQAQEMTVHLERATPQRLRQFLRYLKFFGLLFSVHAGGGERLQIRVDGPLSVLEASTRYGLELANCFPALLLCPPPWRLSATVRLRRYREPLELEVMPDPALRSHYPDTGQWVPDGVRRFVADFNALDTPWRAEAAEAIVPLADNRYLVPDFVLHHPARERPLYLEHVTYPSDAVLEAKLALAEQAAEADLALAARRLPSLAERVRDSPRVLLYRRNLLPRATRDWLDAHHVPG